MKRTVVIIIVIFSWCGNLFAQTDTTLVVSADSLMASHSPKKASIMSALLPGLGQVYNKKYWKLPIVYGGIGASVYFVQKNAQKYSLLKQYYLAREKDSALEFGEYTLMNNDQLITEIEKSRRFTEIAVIATIGVYVLNIIDASVDAHLFYFDVSDDLSINIVPVVNTYAMNKPIFGAGLMLNF